MIHRKKNPGTTLSWQKCGRPGRLFSRKRATISTSSAADSASTRSPRAMALLSILGGLRARHQSRQLERPAVTPNARKPFLASGSGALGLALAVLGVFSVMAYSVSQQQRDFAIHLAVGAEPHQVVSLVLRRALVLVGGGPEISSQQRSSAAAPPATGTGARHAQAQTTAAAARPRLRPRPRTAPGPPDPRWPRGGSGPAQRPSSRGRRRCADLPPGSGLPLWPA